MTVLLYVLAGGVVIGLLTGIANALPGGSSLVPALLRAERRAPERRPEGVARWEGALLAAGTSGARGRGRLGRQLQPLVAATLVTHHGLALDDPRAAALLGDEWAFLNGEPSARGRSTSGDGTDEVVDAVRTLFDRLEDEGRSPIVS